MNRRTLPCYVYRPGQSWRRLRARWHPASTDASVQLPWGLPFRCPAREETGASLLRNGIVDLATSEMLWRLIAPGDTFVDVGANFGYTASLGARRAGAAGVVYAFEPHPANFEILSANAARWRGLAAPLHLVQAAVGDRDGVAALYEPADFEGNRGMASLARREAGGRGQEVRILRLDEFAPLAGDGRVFVKIDVEGFEAAVLEGANSLLHSGRVRHLVFEEFAPYPAATHAWLEAAGFRVFHLTAHLRGPRLEPTPAGFLPVNNAPMNYLATLDAAAAHAAFAQPGWGCLRGRA